MLRSLGTRMTERDTPLPAPPFTARADGGGVITLIGELDLDSAALLRDALIEAGGPGSGSVTLEMSAVTFIDSSGLRVLVGVHNEGQPLTILSPSRQVRRLLEITAMDELFDVRS